jgi:hypothetical protein
MQYTVNDYASLSVLGAIIIIISMNWESRCGLKAAAQMMVTDP